MNRTKEIIRVSVIGIAANAVLAALKAAIGMISGSIAITLDAVNNLSDALSSVITIIGTKLAGRAPDKEHPYGHGRIENVSSVAIAVIVLMAGLTSFKESVEKIIHPEAAEYTAVSLVIIASAVAVKFFLGRYVKKQGEKLKSESLVASGTDASFDAIISLSTLVAAAISLIWGLSVEGYLGVIISAFIIKAGVEILLDSLNSIIGARVDGELTSELKEYVTSFEGVHGAYDLILHRYGAEKTIGSVHIEVDDDMTAKKIHALTRSITIGVYVKYGIILTVGIYASNAGSERIAEIKQSVSDIAGTYPEILQVHGFYVDEETERVSFDLVIDFGADADKMITEIKEKLNELYPDVVFDVIQDTDFSD